MSGPFRLTMARAVYLCIEARALFSWIQKISIEKPPHSCRSSNRPIMARTSKV